MENQKLNLFSLRIDENSKANIKTIIDWVRIIIFLSIIDLVVNIYGLFKPADEPVISEAEIPKPSTRGEDIGSGVIGLIISVVLLIFLYNFVRYVQKGLEKSNLPDISKGFLNLKNYFLVISVIIILVILLLFIFILFVAAI